MENENEIKEKLITEQNNENRIFPIKLKKIRTNNTVTDRIVNNETYKNVEKIYSSRRNKSIEGLRLQKEKLAEWIVEDKKLLETNISIKDLDKFLSTDFEITEISNEKRLSQIVDWMPIKNNKDTTEIENSSSNSNFARNIILKNKILRPFKSMVNLRSLGVELEINLLMAGESFFYIFSRVIKDSFSNEIACCYLHKELESNRKFINFCILEKYEHDDSIYMIKTLKKQEIPKQENYLKNIDICEVNLRFVDNGDNKCFVYIENETPKKPFIFVADFYYPVSDITNVMVAASGDLISLRSLNIKQVKRKFRNITDQENNENIQSCNCCVIY